MNKRPLTTENHMNFRRNCLTEDRAHKKLVTNLPQEMLVEIFKYYLCYESHSNLLKYVSKVCPEFRCASMDSSLWRHVDSSLSKSQILFLCRNKWLMNTVELNLSSMGKELSAQDLTVIFKSCPLLKIINLSNSEKITDDILNSLPTYCSSLTHVNISNISSRVKYLRASQFQKLLENCGSQLIQLDFSFNHISSFTVLIKKISQLCPNLKELILLDVESSNLLFPIENLQEGCPKLEILRLSSLVHFVQKPKNCPESCGFPKLRMFTNGIDIGYGPTNDELVRIIKKSKELKLLDIRGCTLLTPEVFSDLPAFDLEHLFLSSSGFCNSRRKTDMKFLGKWSHCLKELDLSRAHTACVNNAILHLQIQGFDSPIESLDLSKSDIDTATVAAVLAAFPHLDILNLNSCHGVLRGIKHLHRGKSELNSLKLKLEKNGYKQE